jgi:hypothetical protein
VTTLKTGTMTRIPMPRRNIRLRFEFRRARGVVDVQAAIAIDRASPDDVRSDGPWAQ